jgi:hypothetical protein
MSIETKISPLIENMFPSFYREEGPNFIAFVKAYYEWLEENSQLLTLDNTTNFNVGDIVTQGNVTGTLIAYVGSDLLVLVDGLETFKCITVCFDLTPITSSSGGSSRISQGGMARRMGSLYLSRNLLNIRDVDCTMDIFLTKFKEKYLCNVEFDTATNKQLLIKNSLDLYRSKGSSRSIDLFFRLVYGSNAKVYYPGDDLFKLSEGTWFKPQYIEITANGASSSRAIDFVGKFVTGLSSGAQAFVEKYIKYKTSNGVSHVLYVTNISGTFIPGELLSLDVAHPDSPEIVGSLGSLGSLNSINAKYGGSEIGDIVDVTSATGISGKAKVTSVNSTTGAVSFTLLDSGWGYSVNFNVNATPSISKTIVSDKILSLSGVKVGNSISSVSVVTTGLNYNNTDIITVRSAYSNAIARPVTNSTGGVTSIVLMSPGAGFFGTPSILVSNSTGGSTTGSNLTASFRYVIPQKLFVYLEDVIQKQALVTFNAGTSTPEWKDGVSILISNGTSTIGTGVVNKYIKRTSSSGTTHVVLNDNFMVSANNKLVLASNNQVTANVQSFVDISATGILMNVPTSGTLYINPDSYSKYVIGEQVYQLDSFGQIIATAKIVKGSSIKGQIPVNTVSGTFVIGLKLYSSQSLLNTPLLDYQADIGVYQISNTFITELDVLGSKVILPFTGVSANLAASYGGSQAKYYASTISNPQTVRLNSDIVANTTMLSTRLSANQFSLPAQSTANLNSVIYNSLSYNTLELGEVYNIEPTDPGFEYTRDPYVLTYQPYTSGYNYKDYSFTTSNANNSFINGEYIQQTYSESRANISVADTSKFIVGERVFTSNNTVNYIANATVFSILAGVVTVNNIQGTIRDVDNLRKFANTNVNVDITSVTSTTATVTAKGILKSQKYNTLNVKRIQFDNLFNENLSVVGSTSGATANIAIDYDYALNSIGWNADVDTNVFTASDIITGLSVVDSGFGFIDGQPATFSLNGITGTAVVLNKGVGVGSGYYKSNKGFTSDLSKLHDGYYYQEYSYDVFSRIPLEKYSDMFKKVMHTAGTKYFGSVDIESLNVTKVSSSNNNGRFLLDNPYEIQDRFIIDIENRSEIVIEIRQ